MTLHRLLLALFLTVIGARVASAGDPSLRAAKHHFERGEKLYALTRFNDALDEYQKAFDAKPIADFLFNIGQCYRNLGDYDSAIFSYQKYLKLAPDAPNRDKVEQLIIDLEAKQDRTETRRLGLQRSRPDTHNTRDTRDTRDTPDEPEPGIERTPEQPVYKKWWFWTGVAVVGVAGGVGIYEVTRPGGPPSTSLGNIVFGK